MPEATVDPDHLSAAREHKVRLAGQLGRMQAVPVAEMEDQPPHHHLRAGIFAPYPGHVRTALAWGQLVHGKGSHG